MAIVPEKVIQEVLIDGIARIKEDDTILDMLFSTLDPKDLQIVKESFRNTTTTVLLGYPRKDTTFPAVSIILSKETEANIPLGNILGAGENPYDVDMNLLQSGTTIPKDFWYGSTRLNSGKESYGTSNPRKILGLGTHYANRKGSIFACTYILHTMCFDQFYTAIIYNIVKFIVENNLVLLEQNGIYSTTLSGTDLSPLEIELPDPCFERSLILNFMNTFDWFEYASERLKMGITQTEYHLTNDPRFPCPNLTGIPSNADHQTNFEWESSTIVLRGYPLLIRSITPSSITINVETNIYVEGDNIDKDVVVDFKNLRYRQVSPTSYYGIKEIDRYFSTPNELRLRVIGYTTGTTDVKFTNLDNQSYTLKDSLNVVP